LPTGEECKTPSQKLHPSMQVDDPASAGQKEDPFPWKKYIPEGTVDPISLELLVENSYPPFALVVDEPYTPIFPGMWPPVDSVDNGININGDRELAILKQQWGDGVAVKSEEKKDDSNASLSKRKFNLFDGHVLAFYLVSTQQFIDPYNRRDLTRGELEALDDYLAHNHLSYAGVCLAYDNRVSISTAGSRAQSAAGRAQARAEMLRQNADSILSQMFTVRNSKVGGSTKMKKGKSRDSTSGPEKIKMIDREAMESLQQEEALQQDKSCEFRDRQALESALRLESLDDTGVYGREDGGFLLIDDDENPGLRGRVQFDNQAAQQFPSLATTKMNRFNTTAHKWGAQTAKETDIKLVEKERKAKGAESRRHAEESLRLRNIAMAPMTIEFIQNDKKKTISISSRNPQAETKLSEEKKKRPYSDYSKLNVLKPAPSATENVTTSLPEEDQSINPLAATTGWSRLVSGTADVNPAKYTASLIAGATIHRAELAKLEKQLIKFLTDDKKSSLSLKPMESRPLRKFVHDYCQYWKLLTEGFDAAGDPSKEVYIVCKKQDNTCAPHPLLSEAAKHPMLGVTFKTKKTKGRKKLFEF